MRRKRQYTAQNPELQSVVAAEFKRLSEGRDCIGAPDGKPAYAYLRVSSDAQAEEGRSGLPRQLEHVHEIASQKGLSIPLDLIRSDDHTGYEFEGRPALTVLMTELKNGRRADYVVMESHGRLSRDAEWHQGYLKNEMKKCGVTPVFWEDFNSRIERAIRGAVDQEKMDEQKKMMADGRLRKLNDGRVFGCGHIHYGYKLVDSHGNEGWQAKKDSHYAPKEPQASFVRDIFTMMADGHGLRAISRYLSERTPSPAGKPKWATNTISKIIKNPVYKGEYTVGREVFEKRVRTGEERPESEWKRVSVPALVSSALWQAANDMAAKNAAAAKRNARREYLLTGLMRCASCGYAYVGTTTRWRDRTKPDSEARVYMIYACRGHRELHICSQSTIMCHKLNDAVWAALHEIVETPGVVGGALDEYLQADEGVLAKIEYLNSAIAARQAKDEKDYTAYHAGAFDADEFAEMRRNTKTEIARLEKERAALQRLVHSPEEIEAKRREIRTVFENYRKSLDRELTIEEQKRVLRTLIDHIDLNVQEGWFDLFGVVNRRFAIESTCING